MNTKHRQGRTSRRISLGDRRATFLVERLENRLVLSAPPAFGDVPPVLDIAEGHAWSSSSGMYHTYTFPISDPDTPLSSLTFSVVSIDKPASSHCSAFFFSPPHPGELWIDVGDGPFQATITVKVTDETGLSDTAAAVLNIFNVPPAVSNYSPLGASTLSPVAGQVAQFFADAYDLGGVGPDHDGCAAWWDFGDGTVTPPQTITQWRTQFQMPVEVGTAWAQHVFASAGSYTVNVFVQDDDGGISTPATFNVIVAPAPPAIGTLPAVINLAEGEGGGYTTGGFYILQIPVTDADTPTSGLVYSIDPVTTTPPERAATTPFITPDGRLWFPACDGPYQQSITLRVTDNTGLFDTETILFNVANNAPSVSAHPYSTPNLTPLVGQPAGLCAMARDPFYGGSDALVVWWDFGDGVISPPEPATGFDHYGAGPGTFTFVPLSTRHAYAQPGSYTVKVFVQDDEGACAAWTMPAPVVVSGSYRLSGNRLEVGGLPGNDTIHVSPAAGGKVNLFLGGALKGAFAAASVIAWGAGGDDTLDAAETLNLPVEFYGGPGNDLLRGAMANDALFGEEGNDRIEGRAGHDILVGAIGNDRLRGCAGCDLILAGTGFDSLYGDADDDIIVAGRTSYDADLFSLQNILREWTSGRPYAVRVDNIRDGSGSLDRVNGSCFLNAGTTVFDDSTEDWLNGVGGNDWFFGNSAKHDKLMDRAAYEEVDLPLV